MSWWEVGLLVFGVAMVLLILGLMRAAARGDEQMRRSRPPEQRDVPERRKAQRR